MTTQSDGADGGKRKRREYFERPLAKKHHAIVDGRRLAPGARGFLVTHQTARRSEAIREVYNLLNAYADEFFPPSGSEKTKSEGGAPVAKDDIEAELRRECASLRPTASRGAAEVEPVAHRFHAMDAGVKGILFVRSDSAVIEPGEFVHRMLDDLRLRVERRSRYIQRIHPVQACVRAHARDIEEAVAKLLPEEFETFRVEAKIRNNSELTKDVLLAACVGVVKAMRPLARVRLEGAEWTIIADVMQTNCCVAVVREYEKLRRFNVQELGKV